MLAAHDQQPIHVAHMADSDHVVLPVVAHRVEGQVKALVLSLRNNAVDDARGKFPDVCGRKAVQKANLVGALAAEGARRGARMIVQLAGGIEHALPGAWGDFAVAFGTLTIRIKCVFLDHGQPYTYQNA